MYKCICGKEFNKPASFNGHKSHCKIHLGERYNEIQNKQKQGSKKGGTITQQIYKAKTLKKKQQWIEEQHQCEYCGKIMTEKYASGRFCNRSCSNSFTSNQNREEKNRKISESIKNKETSNYIPKVICKQCGQLFSAFKADTCPECRKRTPEEIKRIMSNKGKQRYLEGKTGWKHGSHYLKNKYEIQIAELLDLNGIQYVDEVPIKTSLLGVDICGAYYPDFLIDGYIDLEIDGNYHEFEEQLEKDRIRDQAFIRNGYLVYRLKYLESSIEEEFTKFLQWYSEHRNVV